MKFSLIPVLSVLFLFVSCSSQNFEGFEDKVFIECIKKLDKKFEEIQELDCSNTEETLKANPFGESLIHSIKGIEKLTNLEKLVLKKNKIVDISMLSQLTKLKHLDLGENEITSMYPLETLTGLTYLNLDKNFIGDMRPVKDLVNLEELDLSRNGIQGLADFSKLKKLKKLYNSLCRQQ